MGRKLIIGVYRAWIRVAIICWSNTRRTEPRKRRSWRSSWAKALITRMPETFSSASAVSSAIRCWASCIAGRECLPYLWAISTTNGTGASDMAASVRLEREHRDRGQEDRQQRLADEDQSIAQEEAHRLEIDGGPGHELAGLLAVEERQFQALKVLVQAVAEVELDPQRDPAGHQAAENAHDQAEHPGHADRERQHHQLVLMMLPPWRPQHMMLRIWLMASPARYGSRTRR